MSTFLFFSLTILALSLKKIHPCQHGVSETQKRVYQLIVFIRSNYCIGYSNLMFTLFNVEEIRHSLVLPAAKSNKPDCAF